MPDERVRLVDGLAALLLAWSNHEPLLLVIDDAQWIDDSSLAVMSLLCRSIEGPRSESSRQTRSPGTPGRRRRRPRTVS